ncbi:MAG: TolC family protein, partial [Candidatus Methylomirabilales bacterium]
MEITKLEVQVAGPASASLLIHARGSISTYESFSLPDPPRLVIQILNAVHAIPQPIPIAKGGPIAKVRSAQYRERPIRIVRLVVDLVAPFPYRVEAEGHRLKVLISKAVAEAPAVPKPQEPNKLNKPKELPPASEAAPEAKAADLLPLSLRDGVLLALQNNPEIRIERLNPRIREGDVERERGAFYPRLTFDISTDRSEKPTGTLLAGSPTLVTTNFDFNSGVRTRVATGGLVSLDFRNKRFESNSAFQVFDPMFTSDFVFTLTHPLLRNFGIGVNKTRISVAQNAVGISRHQLKVVIANVITDVQSTYWDLVLASKDLEARRRSLELAQHLERRAQEMVALGRLPPMAILQAKAGVREREIDLLAGEGIFRDAQARLKTLLNLDTAPEAGNLTIVPVDQPSFEAKEVSVEESLKAALAKRPELLQARLDLENKQLALRFAKNQLLPELNFVGSVGLSGLGGTQTSQIQQVQEILGRVVEVAPSPFQGGYSEALDNLLSGDFVSWRVGLTLEIPLGNRPARSEFQKARLEMEKAELALQLLERRIALEVEKVAREIKTAFKAVEGARGLRELAERRLQMAQEGFEL